VKEIINRKWFFTVVSAWLLILILDEIAFHWFHKVNPASLWSGLYIKHPPVDQPDIQRTGYPNGYRPAGGP
jgi:hypothetical protein